MRKSAALLSASLLVACGSRSGLLDLSVASGGGTGGLTGGSGGSGGSAASGGSGGIGAIGANGGSGGIAGTGALGGFGGGGIGGGPSSCDLSEILPRQTLDHPGVSQDRNPKLGFSSDANDLVTVLFTRAPGQGNATKLEHASFNPWGNWPGSGVIAPTFETFSSPELTDDFRMGGSSNNHFSALVEHAAPGVSILSFVPGIDAFSNATGPNATVNGSGPLFVARGPTGSDHMVGTAEPGSIRIQTFFETNLNFVGSLGCADSSVVADAIPDSTGWLVALSNAKNAPNIGCAGVDPGPPMRIDVVHVTPGGSFSYVLGFEVGAPVSRIAMAPHPSGAWVVYRVASGGIVAPIRWARIDVAGAGIVGPGDISGPADLPLDGFDASAGGTKLAVAWGNDPAGNPPDLTLTLLEESGALVSQTAFEPSFFGELSVLVSPSIPSLLVSWSEGTGKDDVSVRVARFDCIFPL